MPHGSDSTPNRPDRPESFRIVPNSHETPGRFTASVNIAVTPGLLRPAAAVPRDRRPFRHRPSCQRESECRNRARSRPSERTARLPVGTTDRNPSAHPLIRRLFRAITVGGRGRIRTVSRRVPLHDNSCLYPQIFPLCQHRRFRPLKADVSLIRRSEPDQLPRTGPCPVRLAEDYDGPCVTSRTPRYCSLNLAGHFFRSSQ